jgi:hypothetical protein
MEYKFGNVYYFQEMWEEARLRFEKARRIWQEIDTLHPTATAVDLKLATIMIKQGHYDEAM